MSVSQQKKQPPKIGYRFSSGKTHSPKKSWKSSNVSSKKVSTTTAFMFIFSCFFLLIFCNFIIFFFFHVFQFFLSLFLFLFLLLFTISEETTF